MRWNRFRSFSCLQLILACSCERLFIRKCLCSWCTLFISLSSLFLHFLAFNLYLWCTIFVIGQTQHAIQSTWLANKQKFQSCTFVWMSFTTHTHTQLWLHAQFGATMIIVFITTKLINYWFVAGTSPPFYLSLSLSPFETAQLLGVKLLTEAEWEKKSDFQLIYMT